MGLATLAARTLLAAALALSAGGAGARDWPTIRIATEGAYPPFNFIGPDGRLQGFEIDLAKAVCAELKATCTFVAQDWEGIIPALLAGKYDAVFASLSITDERKKVVAFTDRYYSSPSLFAASKENAGMATTPTALSGKVLGAQLGTVSARYLVDLYEPAGAELKLYATQDEANLDLASGRLDASLVDKFVLLEWLGKPGDGACCRVIGPDYSDPKYFGEGVGAALRKEDGDLKTLLDRGLQAVRSNGEYDRVTAKYFSFSIY